MWSVEPCTAEQIGPLHFVQVEYDGAGAAHELLYLTFGVDFFFHLLPAALEAKKRLEVIRQFHMHRVEELDEEISMVQETIGKERKHAQD